MHELPHGFESTGNPNEQALSLTLEPGNHFLSCSVELDKKNPEQFLKSCGVHGLKDDWLADFEKTQRALIIEGVPVTIPAIPIIGYEMHFTYMPTARMTCNQIVIHGEVGGIACTLSKK